MVKTKPHKLTVVSPAVSAPHFCARWKRRGRLVLESSSGCWRSLRWLPSCIVCRSPALQPPDLPGCGCRALQRRLPPPLAASPRSGRGAGLVERERSASPCLHFTLCECIKRQGAGSPAGAAPSAAALGAQALNPFECSYLKSQVVFFFTFD